MLVRGEVCQQGEGLHSAAAGLHAGKNSGLKNDVNSLTATTGRRRGAEINMFSIRGFLIPQQAHALLISLILHREDRKMEKLDDMELDEFTILN